MNVLLDTQILLWALIDSPKLREPIRGIIQDPDNAVHVSSASVWEIVIKSAGGKLRLPSSPDRWIPEQVKKAEFVELPVTIRHAVEIASLPRHHSDPFDRILIAQARVEGLTLLTTDAALEDYDVRTRFVSRVVGRG